VITNQIDAQQTRVETVMQIMLGTRARRIGSEIYRDTRNVDKFYDCDRTRVELIDITASEIIVNSSLFLFLDLSHKFYSSE
jgi:hypothetical protein